MALTVKHKIALFIEWQSIYRDIADKCDMMAKAVRLSAGEKEELGERLEGDLRFEDDYSNFIRREMTTALSYIQVELNKWIWESGHVATARIIKEDTIKIIAHTPKTFDLSLRYPLARLIEAYLVNRALMMWCAIYHKADTQIYTALAQEAMQGIKRIKNSRIRYFGKAQDVYVIVGDSGEEPEPMEIPVETVTLSHSEIEMETESEKTISVTNILPKNATDKSITWTSSNEEVAKVIPENDGMSAKIVNVKKSEGGMSVEVTGTATIKAAATSGAEAQCVVKVNGKSTGGMDAPVLG